MSVFEIYKNILTCMLLKEMDVVTTNTESAVAHPSPPLPSPALALSSLVCPGTIQAQSQSTSVASRYI